MRSTKIVKITAARGLRVFTDVGAVDMAGMVAENINIYENKSLRK